MEGIVAKRTLKKSYYNNRNISNTRFGDLTYNETKQNNKKEKSKLHKYREKLLYKMSIQTITMISILAFVLAIKYLNIKIVLDADITKNIVNHYQQSYSASQIFDGVKDISQSIYIFVKPVIPDSIENRVKELYKGLLIKEEKIEIIEQDNNKNQNDEKKNNEVVVYEESSVNNKENTVQENVGVSVETSDQEEKVIAVSSSISSEQNIVDKIKKTKIEFVKPVRGTITSHFGAREVIFEGIDSYHTGTDIATGAGTKVVSSIAGKVTRATYNKYNGNFVEVTNGEVSTIYCHMSKLFVEVGDSVKSGTKIGEVGSTGLSTGPHLHFEIVYDGTKVDPELVLEL